MREYPAAFEHKDGQIPYYAIINEDNLKLYGDYKALADKIENLHLLGRLAEYKYYNMDDIVARALSIWEE